MFQDQSVFFLTSSFNGTRIQEYYKMNLQFKLTNPKKACKGLTFLGGPQFRSMSTLVIYIFLSFLERMRPRYFIP